MRILISEYDNGEWIFTEVSNGNLYRCNNAHLKDFCNKYSQYYFIILSSANLSILLREILLNFGIKHYFYNVPETKKNNEISEILAALYRIEKNIGDNTSSKNSFFSFSKSGAEKNVVNDSKQISTLTKIETQIVELSEKISGIEYIVNELYNQDSSHDDISCVVIEDLRRELSSYKNDFYLKSMQKYGVDIAIKIIDRLYLEKRDIEQKAPTNTDLLDKYNKFIEFCTSEFKRLNLKILTSISNVPFDGERMVSFEDYVETDDVSLVGKVAYSISPAVIWMLPRINEDSKNELVIKEEVVALYKTK